MKVKIDISPAYNNRFIIMNADMNFILDDAQGYGFSTYVKALEYAKVKYRNNKNIEIIDESPVSESLF
jgi:hypothetical protein